VNVFDERLGAPSSPRSLGWYWLRIAQDLTSPGRAALAVMVVFILLATSGWTAMRHQKTAEDPSATAVSAWLHGSIAGHGLPNPDAGTAAISHFFSSLSNTQRRRLADRYPLVVGNLGGAPIPLRYQANRIALGQAEKEAEKDSHSSDLTADGRQLALQLANRYAELSSPRRQILSFDPRGRGLVSEVFGNLMTARRTAVVVPGVDTDLLTYEKPDKPYSAPEGMAEDLYNSERAIDPGAKTAVIAWADYTTPQGLGLDASTGELAEAGAVRLNDMVRALPRQTRVQLFCHSYGSVLCGVGASRLPQQKVTDITVAGSPGMRASTVTALHTRARVWAARDETDWIQNVPYVEVGGLGHGTDPVSPSFGARIISAAKAQDHTGYFADGTESLRNFTWIALGEYQSVRCATDSPDCTAGATA
jgi:Alpha/beta hydrolase